MGIASASRFLEATSALMAKAGMLNTSEEVAFRALQFRLMTILPEQYQDRYETVEPVSMGSAALKYGDDGKVAWGDIWDSFCDLAMAGGPPHKGVLLQPGTEEEIARDPARYRAVTTEIIRGIRLASDAVVSRFEQPGWIRLDCGDPTTAQWLLMAVTMENISCRWEETWLDLPAAPHYRVEKEIKNVITTVAKTTHYWYGHVWRAQREEIGKCFARMAAESPLVQPATAGRDCPSAALDACYGEMAARIQRETGLAVPERRYAAWVGVECPSVSSAVWMMRLLAAANTLARREQTVLFLPVHPAGGHAVTAALARVHSFAKMQAVL